MAKVVRGVDSYKKEFLSIFNSLCGRHGRWEVWSDFIQLTAIDISNVTDKANAPKRAADARNIAKKYSEDEIKRMAEMLMQMVYAIDGNPDQDFLGELYMTCELGNDHAGQFFTPYSVCQAMSEISFDPARFEDIGFVSVNDCACGAGALLLSFANICKRKGINYQEKVLFIAQDIDYIVGLMCYIQLTLMGCAGYVVIGDTLTNPTTCYDKHGLLPAVKPDRVWYTMMFSNNLWYGRRMAAQMDALLFRISESNLQNPAEKVEIEHKIVPKMSKSEKKIAKKAVSITKSEEVETNLNENKFGQLTFF